MYELDENQLMSRIAELGNQIQATIKEKEALKKILYWKYKPFEYLKKIVFDELSIDLDKDTNKHEISIPRQVVYYLIKMNTKLTYRIIGENIGGKDHATVLHGVKNISTYVFGKEIHKDDKYISYYNQINNILKDFDYKILESK